MGSRYICIAIEYCYIYNFRVVIFLRNSRLLKVFRNKYDMKITLAVPFGGNTMKNANLNPREMVNLLKYAKMYTPGLIPGLMRGLI